MMYVPFWCNASTMSFFLLCFQLSPSPKHNKPSTQERLQMHQSQSPKSPNFSPLSKPVSAHKKTRSEVRKCRKVYGMENRDMWCTQCKWKKACSRFTDWKQYSQQEHHRQYHRCMWTSTSYLSLLFLINAHTETTKKDNSYLSTCTFGHYTPCFANYHDLDWMNGFLLLCYQFFTRPRISIVFY